jgi:hypothetical protein
MADDDFDIYGDDEAYEPVREVRSTTTFDFECPLISFAASFEYMNVFPASPRIRSLLESSL